MMNYNSETKELKIRKIEPVEFPINLLKDQKESYSRYLKETIYGDIEYLCSRIMDKTNIKDLTATVRIGDIYGTRARKEIKRKGNEYRPVMVTFYVNGDPRPEVEVMKIPSMNDYCVLNVEGKERVLLSELRSVEEISYDDKKKYLTVSLPHRAVTIAAKSKSIKFKLGESFIDFDKVLMGFIQEDGESISLADYFRNSYILSTLIDMEFKTEGVIEDEIAKTNIVDVYRSEGYRLGNLRKSLNKRLTIDKAKGKILSRDVELKRHRKVVEAGTLVTPDLIKDFKFNMINEVYIKAVPKVAGWYLVEPIRIDTLPRSSAVNDYVKKLLPRFSKFNYLPKDEYVNIVIPQGVPLSEDMLQTFFDAGVSEVTCSSNKSLSNIRTFYFEQEIVGNYTAKVSDLFAIGNIPDHLNADDYTYYYGLSDPSDIESCVAPEYFTCHDLLAIVSMLARIQTMPELNEQFNRDIDFLKKVNLINETFSDSFRAAIEPWIKQAKSTTDKFMLNAGGGTNPFFGLTAEWLKVMRDKKLLRGTEGVNPISLLTQANRIASVTASSKSVPMEMRNLAMGFYGRICPYETPAGKNIGLVNTLAIGCKIVDGILLTPYHKVSRIGSRYRVQPTVTYLSYMDELDHRIGDIMDIEMDKNRILKDTKVTARVPAPAGYSEKTTVATISSYSLDYVNALPEQHLSPTAMLIPFASSDDGARVSFGLNLIRQSIYVQHSQVPYVTTSMYKKVFDYSDTYIIKAKKSGVVKDISSDTLTVLYDGEKEEESKHVPETRVTNYAVTVMNYKVRVGDRFEAGQVLVDSDVSREGYFTPGVNLLTAYMVWNGHNYEDAVLLSEKASNQYISISGNTVEKELRYSDSEIPNLNPGNYFKYIPEGGVICTIDKYKGSDERRDSKEHMVAHKASGILYDIQIEENDRRNRIVKAQLLGFNRLGPGDKMSGRHGNKGVNARKEKNSSMPMFKNGRIIDAVLNPCGVVSRMNIGQVKEAHTGFVAYLLGIRIETDAFNGASIQDIKDLMKFVHDLANRKNVEESIAMNPGFPEGLYERARERHEFIREWEDCFLPDGSAYLYNQETGKMFEYPITFGMPYLLKIEQEVDHKMHARAGVIEEDYSMLEKQPTKGSKVGGGQNVGEMEMWAILSHGATEVAKEDFNEKSDNVDMRINLLMDNLGKERIYNPEDTATRTSELWRYYMEVAGVHVDIDELPPVDYDTVVHKTHFDAKALTKSVEETNRKVIQTREKKVASLKSALNQYSRV